MKKLLAFSILLFFLSSIAYASYGARPLGMGGAFTAIADDANAAYWNPAGFAINPGMDITGSTLITNRNDAIGDNIAAFKACFEAEVNPFIWILGIGAAALVAYEGAKYLHEQGVVEKNWDRPDAERVDLDKPMREQVFSQGGEEKTVAVGQKIKEKAKAVGKDLLGKTEQAASQTTQAIVPIAGQTVNLATQVAVQESIRQAYWGPYRYPWYEHDYRRPSYWDYRNETKTYSANGKAQFAGGLTVMMDKNPILQQDTNYYTASLASGYQEMVALGGNFNFYDVGLYTSTGGRLKGYGAGFDAGALFRPLNKLAFGLVAKEILTTDIRFENGVILSPKMSVNGGVAILPIDMLTLALDMHNMFAQQGSPQTYHYGAELRPFPGLALRAGLNDNNKCAGAALMVANFIVDYAYLGGAFNRTQIIGLTYKM